MPLYPVTPVTPDPPASLHDVNAAMLAALSTMQATPATPTQPFALVRLWAGEFMGPVDTKEVNAYPCALLAAAGGESRPDIETVASSNLENRDTDQWTVFVATTDPKSDAHAVAGDATFPTTGVPGALRLVDAAIKACNGLVIPGLWQDSVVLLRRWKPHLIKRGVIYAYAVIFATVRVAPQASRPDTSVSLDETTGTVTSASTPGGTPVPLASFDVDPQT